MSHREGHVDYQVTRIQDSRDGESVEYIKVRVYNDLEEAKAEADYRQAEANRKGLHVTYVVDQREVIGGRVEIVDWGIYAGGERLRQAR